MRARRVRRYRLPGYPTRLEVLAKPNLLREHQPSAWRKNAEMAGLVTVFLAANGCVKNGGGQVAMAPEQAVVAPAEEQGQINVVGNRETVEEAVPEPPKAVEAEPAENEAVEAEVEGPKTYSPGPGAAAAVVAPIFEHGEGRGATGCVAVAPPVLLSEEEAIQIIGEELSLAGINAVRDIRLKGVLIPEGGWRSRKALEQIRSGWMRSLEYYREKGDTPREDSLLRSIQRKDSQLETWKDTEKELHADVFDHNKKIAAEFVSRADYMELGGAPFRSTARTYRFKEVAEEVSEEVRDHGKGFYYATFYDPAARSIKITQYTDSEGKRKTKWDRVFDSKEEVRAESHRLLRQQVKDFVEWLRGQGAI